MEVNVRQNKSIFIFLVSLLLAGFNDLSGQQSTSYQIQKWQIISSAATPNSLNYKLKESNLGVFCPGNAESQSYKLNPGLVFITSVNSSPMLLAVPQQFQLQQNYPNPFNPTTTIEYCLPAETDVKVKIFDSLGRQVKFLRQGKQSPGSYSVIWDAKNEEGQKMPSGIYYYQIFAGDFNDLKKMLLLK